jgi:hypothetical protein
VARPVLPLLLQRQRELAALGGALPAAGRAAAAAAANGGVAAASPPLLLLVRFLLAFLLGILLLLLLLIITVEALYRFAIGFIVCSPKGYLRRPPARRHRCRVFCGGLLWVRDGEESSERSAARGVPPFGFAV